MILWSGVNEDRKVARRIILLLNDIERNGNEGLGKPGGVAQPLIRLLEQADNGKGSFDLSL
jgi:Plasmid encoded toxin Txe.